MRRLHTPVLLLCPVSCRLPDMAFVQTRTVFYDNLRNFFQKHNISAASGTERLPFRFSSSFSNTARIVPNTKYEVLNFNFQAMTEASAKIACLTIAEKLVQPVEICTLKDINYLITKPDPANERLKPYIPAGITVI